ncbi:MAG: hypothetical protein GTN93_25610, partial [Anaerolineae bacterium]|nr:hypothetical protein [Anaerolineae bacterium]
RAALQDENAEVQRLAAIALGQLGDMRAIEPLRFALLDEDLKVRQAAMEALQALEAKDEVTDEHPRKNG